LEYYFTLEGMKRKILLLFVLIIALSGCDNPPEIDYHYSDRYDYEPTFDDCEDYYIEGHEDGHNETCEEIEYEGYDEVCGY